MTSRLFRICDRVLAAVGVVLFICSSAVPAHSGRISAFDSPHVWFEGSQGSDWTSGANWMWLPSGGSGVPPTESGDISDPWQNVYITSHMLGEALRVSVIDAAGQTLRSGQLYVGGWDADHVGALPPTYDLNNPPPLPLPVLPVEVAAEGRLEMKNGILQLGEYGFNTAEQKYLRVGYWGRGHIKHSGGDIDSTRAVSVGMGSPDSVGLYELTESGDLRTVGLEIGVQGFGLFRQTGGNFADHRSTSGRVIPAFYSRIGRGYNYERQQGTSAHNDFPADGTGTIPGIGIVDLAGGSTDFDATVSIGFNIGSVGTMHVRNDASVNAFSVQVGRWGSGNFAQTGGSFTASFFKVGVESSGLGSVALRAGAFHAGNFQLGVSGVGNLSVAGWTGQADSISMNSFSQNALSLLHFEITDATKAENTTPRIDVAGTATFTSGARLQVVYEDVANHTDIPPVAGTRFTLLEAGAIVGTPTLIDSPSWHLCPVSTKIEVQYSSPCP